MTLYALVAATTPFESEYRKGTIKNILEAPVQFGREFDGYSSDFKSLIKRLLNKDAQKRPSMSAALASQWFEQMILPMPVEIDPFAWEDDEIVSPLTPHHHHIKVRVQNIDAHEFRLIDSEEGSPLIPASTTPTLYKKRAASMLHL